MMIFRNNVLGVALPLYVGIKSETVDIKVLKNLEIFAQ